MRPPLLAALALAALVAACAASAPTASAPTPATSAITSPSVRNAPSVATAPAPQATTDASEGPPQSPTRSDGAADAPSARTDEGAPPLTQAGSLDGSACNEQAPQDFLVRHNFLRGGREALDRAIQYRTDTYGHFKGFGHAGADAQSPSAYVVTTTFMGLPVRMHRKVVPALGCVEQEIKRTCADHPYTPQALAGIRFRNTYRGGEVTNHIFGIAIDIDPARNTCCGCVKPWSDAPVCTRPSKTEYDRMAMPECWVHAFERYGFYWLGHDVLRDTMHFEFLGDPERILKDAK